MVDTVVERMATKGPLQKMYNCASIKSHRWESFYAISFTVGSCLYFFGCSLRPHLRSVRGLGLGRAGRAPGSPRHPPCEAVAADRPTAGPRSAGPGARHMNRCCSLPDKPFACSDVEDIARIRLKELFWTNFGLFSLRGLVHTTNDNVSE